MQLRVLYSLSALALRSETPESVTNTMRSLHGASEAGDFSHLSKANRFVELVLLESILS
jgi:hypothetical protein